MSAISAGVAGRSFQPTAHERRGLLPWMIATLIATVPS
jgi:hypothetical protein